MRALISRRSSQDAQVVAGAMTASAFPATTRRVTSRADALWIVGALVGGACVGALAASGSVVLVLAAAAGIAIIANRRPYWMPIVAILACAVYLGVYLTYRVALGNTPISVLNLLPLLVFIGACSVPIRERGRGVLMSKVSIPVALLVSGLILGSALGMANGAETYQLLRVVSVEMCLVVGCLAGLIAGGSRGWQKSMVTAFYAAALFAAAQQIVSFLYLVAVGHSIWQAFPFGADVLNVERALASGLIAGTRDNFIATFIMLPALTLSVYRLTARDVSVAAIVLLAMAVSLSRSMWIAAILGIALALLARAMAGRLLHPARVVKLAAVLVAVGVALSVLGGDTVSARLQQTGNEQDGSLQLRRAETNQAFKAVTETPLSATAGIGAGVLLPPTAEKIQLPGFLATGDQSAILENQLLGRWTNFGLLSVFGTILLLLSAALVALRALTRQRPVVDHDLMAMGLALPPLLAVSPFSGTLMSLNLSLPFWILAGTILGANWRSVLRTAGPPQPQHPSSVRGHGAHDARRPAIAKSGRH